MDNMLFENLIFIDYERIFHNPHMDKAYIVEQHKNNPYLDNGGIKSEICERKNSGNIRKTN